METQKVGMREFRDNLATYLLDSDKPLAITRHGDTIGFFLPARRKRTEAEKAAFREAADRWQKVLDDAGINEEEVMEEFKPWRAEQREQPA